MKLKYILALVMCLVVTPAKAELQIDVNGAMRDPLPLAFPEMIHEGFWVGQYAGKIRSVVIADLERSGLFRIIPENSYIQELTSVDEQPNSASDAANAPAATSAPHFLIFMFLPFPLHPLFSNTISMMQSHYYTAPDALYQRSKRQEKG